MADAFATLAREKFPDFLNVLQHVSLLGYGETADGPKLSPFHFGLSNGNGGSGMQRASWCAVKASEHLKASGSPHLPKFGLLQYMQHNEYALVNIAVHVTSREATDYLKSNPTCPHLMRVAPLLQEMSYHRDIYTRLPSADFMRALNGLPKFMLENDPHYGKSQFDRWFSKDAILACRLPPATMMPEPQTNRVETGGEAPGAFGLTSTPAIAVYSLLPERGPAHDSGAFSSAATDVNKRAAASAASAPACAPPPQALPSSPPPSV